MVVNLEKGGNLRVIHVVRFFVLRKNMLVPIGASSVTKLIMPDE